ncbi:ORF III [Nyavirus midwayense]|uniref:ORF III n=1 Tax=Nyavirus midwayense TaxID=644609 RepID=C4NFL2_9MONO|nr:ORF III [Nyavirus midwayense]ACQ94976.1 ORF III [Nyavirus midwayense]
MEDLTEAFAGGIRSEEGLAKAMRREAIQLLEMEIDDKHQELFGKRRRESSDGDDYQESLEALVKEARDKARRERKKKNRDKARARENEDPEERRGEKKSKENREKKRGKKDKERDEDETKEKEKEKEMEAEQEREREREAKEMEREKDKDRARAKEKEKEKDRGKEREKERGREREETKDKDKRKRREAAHSAEREADRSRHRAETQSRGSAEAERSQSRDAAKKGQNRDKEKNQRTADYHPAGHSDQSRKKRKSPAEESSSDEDPAPRKETRGEARPAGERDEELAWDDMNYRPYTPLGPLSPSYALEEEVGQGTIEDLMGQHELKLLHDKLDSIKNSVDQLRRSIGGLLELYQTERLSKTQLINDINAIKHGMILAQDPVHPGARVPQAQIVKIQAPTALGPGTSTASLPSANSLQPLGKIKL